MQLKIYQENVIDDLLTKVKHLLGYSGGKKLVFKSPTGSGKTIMMADFLKRFIDDKDLRQSFGFIWAAPRKLHKQSYKKLEDYFEGSRALKCSYFNDLNDRKISENEILFFNWESINKKDKNTIVKENEQEFYLGKVLDRTREEDRKIILIIDESHYSAGAKDKKGEQAANKIREDIGPDLTIEVSATPLLRGDDDVNVQLEDVKKEGMIKKAVILNDDFDNFIREGKIKTQKLSGGSEELVIDAAMKKRQELVRAFQKEGVNVNPLILIQLPDRKTSIEDRIRERVENILSSKYKISTKKGNNKLAIWLSGEHVNKEDVEQQDSEVQVLIFKQAIALGWDCPRAQILVLFREWHSPIFSIQTVGRIMRMPEPEKGHYKSEILNYGYIYTNLDNIEIQEDIAKDYITIYTSKRRDDYKAINLFSYYQKRHREKTRLASKTVDFKEIFLKEANKYGLKNKINIKARKIDLKIISDQKMEDLDLEAIAKRKIIGKKSISLSGFDLQKLFDYFIRDTLQSGTIFLYPEERSVNRVKDVIYRFLNEELKIDYGDGQDIVLSEKNKEHFSIVIDRSKVEYIKEAEKRENELGIVDKWNIPEGLSFGEEYKKMDFSKSIMQPFYGDQRWKSELAFIKFLERLKAIEWWFKNGDRDSTFFAVPYNSKETFYVDFIIKLKNGKLGLFDPHGTYLSDFRAKSDGLQNYIRNEKKRSGKIFGGLVANTDSRNYKGRWIYFNKPSKELKNNDFSNWVDLEL